MKKQEQPKTLAFEVCQKLKNKLRISFVVNVILIVALIWKMFS